MQRFWCQSTVKLPLDRDERRISELKRLFIKVYEDNAAGRLSDERYEMLSQTYEAEQKQLEADTARLRQEIEVQEAENDHIERFIERREPMSVSRSWMAISCMS